MKRNEQRGYLYLANNSWHVRYSVFENGKRKQRSHRLCAKDEQHPDKESVRPIADDFITAIVAANAANDSQRGHHCPLCGFRCKRNIDGKVAPKESNA